MQREGIVLLCSSFSLLNFAFDFSVQIQKGDAEMQDRRHLNDVSLFSVFTECLFRNAATVRLRGLGLAKQIYSMLFDCKMTGSHY